jgi:hypothetical protein
MKVRASFNPAADNMVRSVDIGTLFFPTGMIPRSKIM